MSDNKYMLEVAQLLFDGVTLEYRFKNRPMNEDPWALWIAESLNFQEFEYRRKPSEPVIMYAPYYTDEDESSTESGCVSDDLYTSIIELYEGSARADGHVEVRVFLK